MVVATVAWTSMVACSDSASTVSGTSSPPDSINLPIGGGGGASASLIECPTTTSLSADATIGPLGGTLSLGGMQVVLPLGAVLQPTHLVLTVPASRYMEIDVSVPGTDHFLFEKPIIVTIDYSRCDAAVTRAALSAWHIDGTTNELLEQMLSIDDKLNHRVVFTTGHLSVYALAN